MNFIRRVALAACVVCAVLGGYAAQGQCLEWNPRFGFPGTDHWVTAMTVFDNGAGPALYAAGAFESASGVPLGHIGKWDGTRWAPLASGITGTGVFALAVFDDGGGPALFAGGQFATAGGVPAQNIAKWNGAQWAPLGSGLGQSPTEAVSALTVYDDGSGPALYAGGTFTTAGGQPANNIARWNGTSWSKLGRGVDDSVSALHGFDDGTGTALYAGGAFLHAGGAPAENIARWYGATSSWSSVGGAQAVVTPVRSLADHDDGSGPALFAGCLGYVGKWNGSAWVDLGLGTAYSFAVHDEGNGPQLWAGGGFTTPTGESNIAKWNGASWDSVGGANDTVLALQSFDDGGGPAIYAGGAFRTAGDAQASFIAVRRGSQWSGLGPQSQGICIDEQSFSAAVTSTAVFDDGTGPALYAAGYFNRAGGVSVSMIAKWDGSSWSPLGSGLNGSAQALVVHDDGGGRALYVGGNFQSAGGQPASHVARWRGGLWSPLGVGVDGPVLAFAVYDDGTGPALYAGGNFLHAGGSPARSIAKWNGSVWSPLGSGVSGGAAGIYALAVFGGSGVSELYAGGAFTSPGQSIARWNGSTWSSVGDGMSGPSPRVFALAVYDDGGGPDLYAGGDFAGPGSNIARWSGTRWSALGSGVSEEVAALSVFDDGAGNELWAGCFVTTGGIVAVWNGSTWSGIGGPTFYGNRIWSFTVYDDGASGGPDLYVGGRFDVIGGVPATSIAQWQGCAGPGTLACFGDGSLVRCPCGNTGDFRRGCQNSASTGGALLSSSGTAVPDSAVLTVTGELSSALTIFLQGNALIAPVNYGDGLRCAGGALKRLYVKSASGGQVSAPAPGDPSITARSATLGDPIPTGAARYYLTYYRDRNPGFCPSPQGNAFNSSNGVTIAW